MSGWRWRRTAHGQRCGYTSIDDAQSSRVPSRSREVPQVSPSVVVPVVLAAHRLALDLRGPLDNRQGLYVPCVSMGES